MPRFKIGDDVYVKSPQSLIADCVSVTGDVVATRRNGEYVTLDAYVAKMGGGYPIALSIRSEGVGKRIGTPISKISTQPGTPGYSEWLRISRSWGHP